MLHILYRRYQRLLLQLSYFIAIFDILVAVRLRFRSYRINKIRYDDS